MNSGPLLFLGILASIGCSFWALLFAPQLQLGSQQPVVIESTGELYPAARPGVAQQGAEVYRSLGCVECHSQQVRQSGVSFELWLAEAGTNKAELSPALSALLGAEAVKLADQAPVRLTQGLTLLKAQRMAGQLTNGGARAQAVLANLGPDIERGWGKRLTVSQDFLRDYPVQLGNLRVGPDLANYGRRFPGAALALAHLYAPQMMAEKTTGQKGSMMPPYRFLFDKRKLAEGEKPGLLDLEPGYEVTPKPEAEALVAYLNSLRADAPLAEAPVPAPPQPSTPAAVPAPVK